MTPVEKLKKYLRMHGPNGVLCTYMGTQANGGKDEVLTVAEFEAILLNVVYHRTIFKEVWPNKMFSPEERAAVYENLMTAIDEIDKLFDTESGGGHVKIPV